MAGALDGIRVIDFGQYLAGPLAAMLLGDQGADVVHVDPPGGPRLDSAANATLNRNKQSIVLDLKDAGDLETARKLVEGADVVIENFRPGVMERLGLGAAAMTKLNPALVYCSLPGFASDDPRRDTPAWEGILGAATGTYAPNPHDGNPSFNVVPTSSVFGAILAAISVTMALNARQRDGAGQTIEMPLFDATLTGIGGRGLTVHGRDPLGWSINKHWTGEYQCKDGRWLMYQGANQNFGAFVEAVGAEGWVDGSISIEEMRHRATELFRTRTAWDWETFCQEVGTEGNVVRTCAEWLRDPHAGATGQVLELDDPIIGRFSGPGINVRLSGTPGSTAPRHKLDSDRAAILAELAQPRPRPASPASDLLTQALQGVRVVEVCTILVGPTCGRTLMEYGADVIKVDSPHRPESDAHYDVNRGKRSILLDLKTPEGLDIFWQLVDKADVVLQNYRKGVAERLGIGYEQVRARRPDIVYGSLSTFGREGPYSSRPGHDYAAQAAAGMQERYGGDNPKDDALHFFAVNDYGAGLLGAYGVAAALLHRQRTGQGQHVDSSLADAATLLQANLLQDYAGKEWDYPRGQDALGTGPLNRAYKAGDGWLFLSCRPSDLSRSEDLADIARLDAAEQEQALAARFADGEVADWVESLNAAGIGAHRVEPDVRALMKDPWLMSHGLSVTREHEEHGLVTQVGPSPRLSRTPPRLGHASRRAGADAVSILAELGLAEQHERLVGEGVVGVQVRAALRGEM